MRLSAIDVYCSKCLALPSAPCTRPNGKPAVFHRARWDSLSQARWVVSVGHLTLNVIAAAGKVEVSGLWLYAGDDTLTMTAAECAELSSVLCDAVKAALS